MTHDDAIQFYKITKSNEISWLELHNQYSGQYLRLIAAILGVSIAAIYYFNDSQLPLPLIAVIVGPLLNMLLCYTAIRVCDRFYRRFLEAIAIIAKLEPVLGISNQRKRKPKQYTELPFPNDSFYLPERYIKDRKEARTSAEFVKQKKRAGSNKYVVITFKFLFCANAVIVLAMSWLVFLNVIE